MIINFLVYKNRKSYAKDAGFYIALDSLRVGEKVELFLDNCSTCMGWKSSDCGETVYFAHDVINGGYRRVYPIGWKPLPVSMREPA